MKWLHKLLHPHCPDCAAERQESRICQNCETLRSLLDQERYEKQQLLNKLLKEPEEPKIEQAPSTTALRPLRIPWKVRQQHLEEADREKARALRNAAKPDVEELEKEILDGPKTGSEKMGSA